MLPADKEPAQLAVESTRCLKCIILLSKLVAFARRNSGDVGGTDIWLHVDGRNGKRHCRQIHLAQQQLVLHCPPGLLCSALARPTATRDPQSRGKLHVQSWVNELFPHSLVNWGKCGHPPLSLSYHPLFRSPVETTALLLSSGLRLLHWALCQCFVRDGDPHNHPCVSTLNPPHHHSELQCNAQTWLSKPLNIALLP